MNKPNHAVLRRKTMRGGLGRTLLTAFLLLAIGPLAVMSIFAINRTQLESQQQQEQQMLLLAESYGAQLELGSRQLEEALRRQNASPQWYFEQGGMPLPSSPPLPEWLNHSSPEQWQVGGNVPTLWVAIPWEDGWTASTLSLPQVLATIQLPEQLSGTHVYFEREGEFLPLSPNATPLPTSLAETLDTLATAQGNTTFVRTGAETPFLVSRVPLTNSLALVVTRAEADAFATTDDLAAALVAAALVAALVSTVGAALITRRLVRPLYELTRTAVQIARGDLTQRAQVREDNELGILALAFNTMADQLKETLDTLEERVEERTEALRKANAQIQKRAHQLELTAELGAVLGGIHDLEQLLEQAVRLITHALGYQNAAVWLLGRRAGHKSQLTCRACAYPDQVDPLTESAEPSSTLAQRTLEKGHAVLTANRCSMALPLRIGDNLIGSLVLTQGEPFTKVDQPHLQTLADTLTVAIENARASEMERAAIEKLERLEERRAEFLGEMSQELSTSLNSIIGFSHLLLKEVEGPLTDTQRSDLTYINRNGTHLLSLLDGLLDVLDGEQMQGEQQGS